MWYHHFYSENEKLNRELAKYSSDNWLINLKIVFLWAYIFLIHLHKCLAIKQMKGCLELVQFLRCLSKLRSPEPRLKKKPTHIAAGFKSRVGGVGGQRQSSRTRWSARLAYPMSVRPERPCKKEMCGSWAANQGWALSSPLYLYIMPTQISN